MMADRSTICHGRLAYWGFGLLLLMSAPALAYDPGAPPPAGAPEREFVPIDWSSFTVRGQDTSGLIPTATQTAATERAPGFGRGLRKTTTTEGVPASPTGGATEEAAPAATAPPTVESVVQADSTLNQTPDVGSTIEQSNNAETINFRQNSPLSREPYIRTYRDGEVYTAADGLYWAPIRPDLDSMINRIDPSLFDELSIIPGPYGLRYGPGFSFLNIVTVPTPRNPNGYESHFRTGVSTRTNGGQLYGRETVFGGGCDWGYIVHYGGRVGSDYDPGGNSTQGPVPASYKSQSFLGQFGFDLSPDSNLEFRIRRLDDTGLQYALQFFDVDYMGADSYSVHYNWTDPCGGGTLSAMGWYSRSRFHGDTDPGQPFTPYDTIARVEAALDDITGETNSLYGRTFGHYAVAGARLNRTFGEEDAVQLSTGLDVRYVTQRIQEQFQFAGDGLDDFETNLPFAYMVDPGAYAELTVPWLPYLSSTFGARVDWINTAARASELRLGSGLPRSNLEPFIDELNQNDTLPSFYVANELELSDEWNVRLAGGYSRRPPTLLERYADGVFLGIVQSGYSRVIGTPTLDEEENWQVDLSLNHEGERWRGRAGTFYAWTDDPITFVGFPVIDPTGARLLRYTNGEMVTRTGFELAGEFDHAPMWTSFGTVHYLVGRDLDILLADGNYYDRNLTGVFPLDSRVGIRFHDADGGARWGVEFAARMVAAQNNTGSLRVGFGEVLALDDTFEQATPGFTIFDLRTYWNVTPNLYLVGGVENLFDRTYLEHLNLRLPADTIGSASFPEVAVLSPGITPYIGIEWNY